MSEQVKPIAAGQDSAVVEQSDDITMSELIARRSGLGAPKKVEVAEPEVPVVEAVEEVDAAEPEPEVETPPEEEELEPKAEDVPSKEIDLDNLSKEELDELAKSLGSRAVARYGELTAKRKAAEEEVAALKAQMANTNTPDPLAKKTSENNPYTDLDSLESLQAKAQEVDEAIEWAEEILWSSEDLGLDSIVANVGGEEVTKGQVRKVLRDSQKARSTHLPSRLREIQEVAQLDSLEVQWDDAARKELPWMEGEDNDTRKQFEVLKGSPLVAEVIQKVPKIKPMMNYLLAQASNSMYGRKSIALDGPKAKAQIKPPANPNANGANTEKPEGRNSKEMAQLQEKFDKTGASEDLTRLRTAQLTKRKNL